MEARLNFRTSELVRIAIRIRNRKDAIFRVLSEPSWDLLLRLYEARLNDEPFHLDDLADKYPRSTLARWARYLAENDLVECHTNHLLRSDMWIVLSEKGEIKMSKVFQRLEN